MLRRDDAPRMIAESPAMRPVLDLISRVGPSEANVLVTGEHGTGKELVARILHAASPRAARAMVTVNVGGLSEGVFESELFGHERGAFTGARAERVGRFELADGGTLFLDEIANVPLVQQAKLLRVLQTGEFERVGSSRTRRVSVRLVSATNAEPRGGGRGRPLPRGPAVPHQHGRDPPAAAARAPRGHPAARGRVPAPPRTAERQARGGLRARRHGDAAGAPVAGERARAGARRRARRAARVRAAGRRRRGGIARRLRPSAGALERLTLDEVERELIRARAQAPRRQRERSRQGAGSVTQRALSPARAPRPVKHAPRAGQRRLAHESRVALMALGAGLPAALTAMLLIWSTPHPMRVRLYRHRGGGTHMGRILARHPRARGAAAADALEHDGRAPRRRLLDPSARRRHRESAGARVPRGQRARRPPAARSGSDAKEATALLRRVMEEIEVAIFAFDEHAQAAARQSPRRGAARAAGRARARRAGRGARPRFGPRGRHSSTPGAALSRRDRPVGAAPGWVPLGRPASRAGSAVRPDARAARGGAHRLAASGAGAEPRDQQLARADPVDRGELCRAACRRPAPPAQKPTARWPRDFR